VDRATLTTKHPTEGVHACSGRSQRINQISDQQVSAIAQQITSVESRGDPSIDRPKKIFEMTTNKLEDLRWLARLARAQLGCTMTSSETNTVDAWMTLPWIRGTKMSQRQTSRSPRTDRSSSFSPSSLKKRALAPFGSFTGCVSLAPKSTKRF
jgi:hypothetical protein